MKDLSKAGYNQGDMSARVEDMQRPMDSFSQRDANQTTRYVERHDRQDKMDVKDLNKQAYKGRYS